MEREKAVADIAKLLYKAMGNPYGDTKEFFDDLAGQIYDIANQKATDDNVSGLSFADALRRCLPDLRKFNAR